MAPIRLQTGSEATAEPELQAARDRSQDLMVEDRAGVEELWAYLR